MVLNDYTKLLCDLMQNNYDEAVDIESRFQAAYEIEKIEDCAQFIEDLSKDGDWPLNDDGDPLTPKALIERVVEHWPAYHLGTNLDTTGESRCTTWN